MMRLWFLLILNAPLLAEVIRKYLIRDDMVFLAADVLAIVSLLAVIGLGKISFSQIPTIFYLLSGVFISWTLVLHLFSGVPVGIYGVGFRANYMPLVYMLVSASFVKTAPDATRLFYRSAFIWIIIVSTIAVLQVALGRDHPINKVWDEQGLGIGDYTVEGQKVTVSGLFRPTSVFMHTGKFGQTVFMLVLFKWAYLIFSGEKFSRLSYLFIVFDIAALVISGQRGAFLFMAFSLAVLFTLSAKGKRKKGIGATPLLLVGIILASILALALPEYGNAFVDRFYYAIIDIPSRIDGNFTKPMQSVLNDYLASGRGFGYYTFGSRLFGGKIVYHDDKITLLGFGESSLIRLCLEVGFLAALVNIAAFTTLYYRAIKVFKSYRQSPSGAIALFYILWITSLAMWSNTADVFADTVPMFFGYAISGALLLKQVEVKRSKAGNKQLKQIEPTKTDGVCRINTTLY